MLLSLPVLLALSWVPTVTPTATAQKPDQVKPAGETVTCPITGEQIHPCCCPLNK